MCWDSQILFLLLKALKLLRRGKNAGKGLLRALQTQYFSSCKQHTWLLGAKMYVFKGMKCSLLIKGMLPKGR
ncbi:hypothetical protein EK904_003797, partial [Melospiza melodia maxima]